MKEPTKEVIRLSEAPSFHGTHGGEQRCSDSLSIESNGVTIKGIDSRFTQQLIDIIALPVAVAAFCAMMIVIVPLAPAIIAANKLMHGDDFYDD
tara:strand:+ start:900 stop:1181 length:282 start_codon:yes stop_codon:yes gene_type:complete